MIGRNNVTCYATKFSFWLNAFLVLFLVLLSRTALAWSGPCIDVVEEDRIVDGKHFTVVVIGDDTPGCDLYRVVKRFPQRDEKGNELSVHEQLLSIYAVNGERTEGGKTYQRTVLRTCMQADPWPDTTPEEAVFCKNGYVNYPPNGFGGEILVPRTREMTPVERAFAVSKKACQKLDANGLTAKQDAELVADCQKLNKDLAFAGTGKQSADKGSDDKSQSPDSEAVTALKAKNESLKQDMASLQPLVKWGKSMPYVLGLLVFSVCLAGLFAVLYFRKSAEAEDDRKYSDQRDSVLTRALKESDELQQAQELGMRLQAELEQLTQEREAVSAELETERSKRAELEKSLASNVQAGNELVRVNGKLENDLDAVTFERDNYSADLIRVTGEKEKAEARVAELAKAELGLKLQIETGEQNLQAVNEQLKTAQSRISKLESDISRVKFGSMRAVADLSSTVTSKHPPSGLSEEDDSTVTSPDQQLSSTAGFADGAGVYALVARTDGSLGAMQSENSWHDLAGDQTKAVSGTNKPARGSERVSHFPLEVDPDGEPGILDGLVESLFAVMKNARTAEVRRWRSLANEGGQSSVFLEQRLQQATEALAKLNVLEGLDADEKAAALAEILRREEQNASAEQNSTQLGNVLQRRLRTAPLRQVVATAMTCMMALAARQNDGESPEFVLENVDEVTALRDCLNLPVVFDGNLGQDPVYSSATPTTRLYQVGLSTAPVKQVVATAMTCMTTLVARKRDGESPKFVLEHMDEVTALHDCLNLPVSFGGNLGQNWMNNPATPMVQLYQVGMSGYDRLLSPMGSTHQPTIAPPASIDPKTTLVGVALSQIDEDEGSGPRRRTEASESRALSSVEDAEDSDSGERSVS